MEIFSILVLNMQMQSAWQPEKEKNIKVHELYFKMQLKLTLFHIEEKSSAIESGRTDGSEAQAMSLSSLFTFHSLASSSTTFE